MHLKNDMFRAYLDREMPAEKAAQVREHLSHCPECAKRLDEVRLTAQQAAARLDLLAPGTGEQARSSQTAYRRLLMRQKETTPMLKRNPVWAGIAVVAVLTLLLSFTPVRTWASSFLGLFRVEKITVIPINPDKAQKAGEELSGQTSEVENILGENLNITSQGEIQKVSSAEEAASLAGFEPRLPDVTDQTASLYVKPGMQASFTIDQPRLQALLDAVDVNATLPANVNGKVVSGQISDSIVATYGDCPVEDPTNSDFSKMKDCTVLIQLPSPTVEAPEGLDVPKLGEAMFQYLGFTPEEAQSLSESIDWSSTLILPIPLGEDISYDEVIVDGTSGTLLQNGEEDIYSLIWVKDGILYGLAGSGGKDAALPYITTIR